MGVWNRRFSELVRFAVEGMKNDPGWPVVGRVSVVMDDHDSIESLGELLGSPHFRKHPYRLVTLWLFNIAMV